MEKHIGSSKMVYVYRHHLNNLHYLNTVLCRVNHVGPINLTLQRNQMRDSDFESCRIETTNEIGNQRNVLDCKRSIKLVFFRCLDQLINRFNIIRLFVVTIKCSITLS